MTLNGVMAVILRYRISPNLVVLGVHYVKVVKIHRYILRVKCSPKNLVFTSLLAVYHLWRYSQRITPSEGIVKGPCHGGRTCIFDESHRRPVVS